jgi:hypothetical protein
LSDYAIPAAKEMFSQNFYQLNKTITQELGIVASAVFALLVDKFKFWENEDRLEKEKWFFKLSEEIEEELGISKKERQAALELLKSKNLILMKRVGIPSKWYFAINWDGLLKFIPIATANVKAYRKAKEQGRKMFLDKEVGAETVDKKANDIHSELPGCPLEGSPGSHYKASSEPVLRTHILRTQTYTAGRLALNKEMRVRNKKSVPDDPN